MTPRVWPNCEPARSKATAAGSLRPYSATSRGRVSLGHPLIQIAMAMLLAAGAGCEMRTPAEQWVFDRLDAGESADLSQFSPNTVDRVLRGDVVAAILVDKDWLASPARASELVIEHAVISEGIAIDVSEIGRSVVLVKCQVLGDFSANGSTFARDLGLVDCELRGLSVRRAQIGGALALMGSRFTGPVSACYAKAELADLKNAIFEDGDSALDMGSMSLSGHLLMGGSSLNGPLSLEDAKVSGNLEMSSAKLLSEGVSSLRRLEVKGDANFSGTTFDGPVSFQGASIGGTLWLESTVFGKEAVFYKTRAEGDLQATGASFECERKVASLNSVEIDGNIFLKGANFAGGADLNFAHIGGGLYAQNCRSLSSTSSFSLFRLELKGPADFSGAVFHGPVSLALASIGGFCRLNSAVFHDDVNFTKMLVVGDLVAQEASFEHESKSASLNTVKVEGSLFLNSTSFAGGVDLAYAHVGEGLFASDCESLSPTNPFTLGQAHVGSACSLTGAKFLGPVSFYGAVFGADLDLSNAQFHSEHAKVDLGKVSVSQDVVLGSADFWGDVYLTDAVIGGSLKLDDTVFKGNTIYLSRADVGTDIWIHGLHVPKNVFLRGLHYGGTIQGFRGCAVNEERLKLLDTARYTPGAYSTLESSLRSLGHHGSADDVHRAFRRRRRQEELSGLSRAWDWFIEKSVDYGRAPGRALLGVLAVIVIGAVVFRNAAYMVPRKGSDEPRLPYSCVWYSLDLALPAIGLGWADRWVPEGGGLRAKGMRTWMVLQRLIGWVLVPIGLLALFGVIK